MAFWNKKNTEETKQAEQVPEFTSAEFKISHEYADKLMELAIKNGYTMMILCADDDSKTLRIMLPKAKLDKALDFLLGGLGSKFM